MCKRTEAHQTHTHNHLEAFSDYVVVCLYVVTSESVSHHQHHQSPNVYLQEPGRKRTDRDQDGRRGLGGHGNHRDCGSLQMTRSHLRERESESEREYEIKNKSFFFVCL